jgi:hypothetical protein
MSDNSIDGLRDTMAEHLVQLRRERKRLRAELTSINMVIGMIVNNDYDEYYYGYVHNDSLGEDR